MEPSTLTVAAHQEEKWRDAQRRKINVASQPAFRLGTWIPGVCSSVPPGQRRYGDSRFRYPSSGLGGKALTS